MNKQQDDISVVPSCSSQGRKRDREDEQEEEQQTTRRVSQRTQQAQQAAPQAESASLLISAGERSMKDIILKDLRSDNEAVVANAFECLYKMLRAPEKRKEFFDLGGHLATTWIINEHANCHDIQLNGISVLVNATLDGFSDLIRQVDGMQTIITAMKRFYASNGIQFRGLNALHNLTVNCNNSSPIANANLLVKLDGVPMILERMKRFHEDARIVLFSCRLLRSLCQVETLRRSIFEKNALSALAAAMEKYKDNATIVNAAGQSMDSLIKYSMSLY